MTAPMIMVGGNGNETEKEGACPYKYHYGGQDKDFNGVRGDATCEMTAIRKDDDADVVEKTSQKMPTVASPILQQSCKKTVSDCG